VSCDIRENLRKLSFDNWPWTDAQMIILIQQMFNDLDLLTKCNIDVCIRLSQFDLCHFLSLCCILYSELFGTLNLIIWVLNDYRKKENIT